MCLVCRLAPPRGAPGGWCALRSSLQVQGSSWLQRSLSALTSPSCSCVLVCGLARPALFFRLVSATTKMRLDKDEMRPALAAILTTSWAQASAGSTAPAGTAWLGDRCRTPTCHAASRAILCAHATQQQTAAGNPSCIQCCMILNAEAAYQGWWRVRQPAGQVTVLQAHGSALAQC